MPSFVEFSNMWEIFLQGMNTLNSNEKFELNQKLFKIRNLNCTKKVRNN